MEPTHLLLCCQPCMCTLDCVTLLLAHTETTSYRRSACLWQEGRRVVSLCAVHVCIFQRFTCSTIHQDSFHVTMLVTLNYNIIIIDTITH